MPRFFHFTWVDGSDATLAKLGSNGAIVLEQFAKDNHLQVGEPFYVTTTDGKVAKLVVRGIHKPAGLDSLLGSIAISNRVYDKLFTRPRNTMAFVAAPEDTPRSTLENVLNRYPDVTLNTESEFVKDQNAWIDKMLRLLYVLLGLSCSSAYSASSIRSCSRSWSGRASSVRCARSA